MNTRIAPLAFALVLALPLDVEAHGRADANTFDLQSSRGASFITATTACGSSTVPCSGITPLQASGSYGSSGRLAVVTRQELSPASAAGKIEEHREHPARALLGGLGMLVLGCAARLRETRRRAFRLLTPHAH
jgi:hypothetical protein